MEETKGIKGIDGQIALALSGGGFRATLFHLGSLWRLNELGVLPKLKCISCVSGGAITGTFLGLKWKNLDFDENGVARNFADEVVGPIRGICSKNIDVVPSLLNMAAMMVGGVTSALVGQYRKHLFGSSNLQDLPGEGEGPKFIIGGSNLQTGARIWLSRERLFEERLGNLESPDIPLAVVVAISTAFPPFLSPIVLNTDPTRWRESPSSDLHADIDLRRRLVLTDGGIHDPSAVDPLLGDHDTILVSDATRTLEVWRKPSSFWIRQLGRTTIMQTVTNSEGHRLVLGRHLWGDEFSSPNKIIIWWCNADRIDDYGIDDAMVSDSEITRSFGTMRTRLSRFSPQEQGGLINWAYALCDTAIRKHFPNQLPSTHPPIWPIPEHAPSAEG